MDKRIYTGYVYTCGQQMSCYLRTMERIFIRFTGNSNKEDLAFSERVTGRSRAVEIFWKYANYQLVSFLWHCAGFYDRYDCLLSSRFTLSRAFVPCSFVPLCPGFRLVLLLFRVSARNAMRRRLHSFSSSLKNRINPLTQRCFNQRNRVSRIQC